jgi:hypothetical protein
MEAKKGEIDFNQNQIRTIEFIATAYGASGFDNLIDSLGATVLVAWESNWGATNYFQSSTLPDDQWKREAWNLHNMTLAGIQRMIVEFASPPALPLPEGFSTLDFISPNFSIGHYEPLCGSVKMRSAAYLSFNFLGLCILLFIGTFIILADCFLASLIHILGRWYSPFSTIAAIARRQAWVQGDLLHVQQRMLDERGLGPWKRVDQSVPVTEKFGMEFTV